MDALTFTAIFLAIAFGFLLGRRSLSIPFYQNAPQSPIHNRYVEGLKYLLDEQPDAAIDALVTDLEINQDTLEMYMSLGALWRKRGEMERAIRVHETLLISSALTRLQRQQVQLELALDYSYSGVLDRSEVLLKELVTDAHPSVRQSAGRELVLLYQEEKDWEKAVAAADELCSRTDIPDIQTWRHLQAHYYCELVERALGGVDWNEQGVLRSGIPGSGASQAQQMLQEAEHREPNHARVLLLQALLALGRDDVDGAREILERVDLVPDYSMVLVPLMLRVDESKHEDLCSRLMAFYQDSHDLGLLPLLADLVSRKESSERAVAFMIQELSAHAATEPLAELLAAMDIRLLEYEGIRSALKEMLPFHFNCHQCGFQGRQFYWCCPSCKAWR